MKKFSQKTRRNSLGEVFRSLFDEVKQSSCHAVSGSIYNICATGDIKPSSHHPTRRNRIRLDCLVELGCIAGGVKWALRGFISLSAFVSQAVCSIITGCVNCDNTMITLQWWQMSCGDTCQMNRQSADFTSFDWTDCITVVCIEGWFL